MSISSNINVTSGVEGDYTLAKLLDLLGSPASLKAALSKLEASSKRTNAVLKALNTAEELRKVDVARDAKMTAESVATLKAQEEKANDALERLADAKSARAKEVTEREEAVAAAEKTLDENRAILLRDRNGFDAVRATLARERKEHEASVVAANGEAEKTMAAALEAKDEAQRMLDNADAKMSRMREALT